MLTDVGGAKERVVAAARAAVRPGVRFVGAHPMFGGQRRLRRRHAPTAGRAARWRSAPTATPRRSSAVAALHEALGASVVRCTAAEHDDAVAMVSHLPYLVASALALAAREAGPARPRCSPARA